MQQEPATGPVALLVGTRKGAFALRSDRERRKWKFAGPEFLGNIVNHWMLDPRDRRTMLLAAKTGHLGPTIFRSRDFGRTWKEAKRPPSFPKAPPGIAGESVSHVFALSPSIDREEEVWYAGTSPPGLFRSEDDGVTWDGVDGFNEHKMRRAWLPPPDQSPPDGATLHSIQVDPRDPRHLYIGISSGGVFESVNHGRDWKPLNAGCEADFLPDPSAEYGHDPHCLRLHPLAPDRLYQQNHSGVYRMDRAKGTWVRIGKKIPVNVGDIGFPLALHPRDPDTAWVFPMDGSTVWPRVSPGGKPATYLTRDGGRSWTRQAAGLPQEQAWFTVKRQALSTDRHEPVGVYFGTTSGEVFGSRNEGRGWQTLAQHLPHIYSVEAVELSR